MSKVLVHWDESDGNWALHDENDGTKIAGPWNKDPRRNEQSLKNEMYSAMTAVEMVSGDHYYIRESSETPLPW